MFESEFKMMHTCDTRKRQSKQVREINTKDSKMRCGTAGNYGRKSNAIKQITRNVKM